MVQDLAAVEADQGDLRRSRQVQVVSGDRVGFLAVRRELAGADQRFLPDQRRDADQREVLVPEQVQRVGVHRALEQHHVAGQRVGAFPGDLAGPGEVSPAALFQQLHVVQGLEVELRRGAISPDGHVRRLIGPDRSARPRDRGGQQHQPLQLLRGRRELVAQRPEVGLELGVLGPQLGPARLVGLGELPRRALPAGLGLVQFMLQLAADRIEVEQFVHVQVDALDPDGILHRVRVLPDFSPVQHEYASVLVRDFIACQPATKRYQQCPAGRPAVSARYGGYAATREGGGECC